VEQTAPAVVFRTPVPRSRPSAGPHCRAPQASAPHPSRPRVPGPPARLRLLRVGRSPASAHLRAEPSADLPLRPPPQRPARAPPAAHLRALAWAGPASPRRHQPLGEARPSPPPAARLRLLCALPPRPCLRPDPAPHQRLGPLRQPAPASACCRAPPAQAAALQRRAARAQRRGFAQRQLWRLLPPVAACLC
jgi:hypothetical protein